MAVYAIADLHGRMDLYQEVCKFLNPEDKVFCLGDCGDRGPHSWELIKTVYENPQWEYIMGNHEHMLFHAMLQYSTGHRGNSYNNPIAVLASNGGAHTLQGWIEEGANYDWVRKLSGLSRFETYENESGYTILLSHAGRNPNDNLILWDLLWDREHLYSEWPEDTKFDKTLVIHGHTPIPLMVRDLNNIAQLHGKPSIKVEPGAFWYANTHKINLDCGAYSSGYTVLLDLDTFDEHIFHAPAAQKLIEK